MQQFMGFDPVTEVDPIHFATGLRAGAMRDHYGTLAYRSLNEPGHSPTHTEAEHLPECWVNYTINRGFHEGDTPSWIFEDRSE
jgi:hypothetical protein